MFPFDIRGGKASLIIVEQGPCILNIAGHQFISTSFLSLLLGFALILKDIYSNGHFHNGTLLSVCEDQSLALGMV